MKKETDQILEIGNFIRGVIDICDGINYSDINQTITCLYEAWQTRNTIFLIGNGGSASTASHFAADLNNCTAKMEYINPVKALSLVDNLPRLSALTNDEGWNNVYISQLKNYFQTGDIVIGISVHGGSGADRAGNWSQNLLLALQYAKDNGGKALGLTGFDGGAMKKICDVCINVPYETTPHVEGFHGILTHLISYQLTKKIREFSTIYE